MDNSSDNTQGNIIDVKKLIYKIASKWFWLVISLFIAFSIAYFINKYTDPVYNTSATILLTDKDNALVSGVENIIEEMGLFKKTRKKVVENEVGILESYTLNSCAIKELNFRVSYFAIGRIRTPEIYNTSPFVVNLDTTFEQLENHPVNITILSDKEYKLEIDEGLNIKKVLKFGEQFVNKKFNFNITLTDKFNPLIFKSDNSYYFIINNLNQLTNQYRKKLSVAPSDKKSSILILTSHGYVPQKEVDYLNKLSEIFIRKGLEEKNQIALNTIKFIDEQLNSITDSLQIAENNLQNFKLNNKIISVSDESTTVLEKMVKLQTEQATLLSQSKYYDYLYKYVQGKKDFSDIIAPSSIGIEDQLLNSLISQLNILYSKKAEMLFISKEKNPGLHEYDIKIQNTRNALIENVKNIINESNIAIKDMESRIAKVDLEFQKLPVTEKQYINIQRKYTLSDNIYTFLLEKRADAGIAKASNIADNKVLDQARIDNISKITPKTTTNYLIALVLGFMLPILFILIIDFFNDKIVEKSDIEKYTNVPILGVIGHNDKGTDLVVFERPKSSISESFRTVRTNLQYINIDKKEQGWVISITSTVSGEGKTFCAINIASIFAFSENNTVILGLDLRKPKLHKDFGISNEIGLSTYLIGNNTLDEVIFPTTINNLYFIPSGPVPPNPAELLETEKMFLLVELLKSKFKYIIMDTPPVAIVTDALLLSKYADTNIFVVRQNYSKKNVINFVNDLFKDKNLKTLCILINDVKVPNYYGYKKGYGYRYGGYGYHYGYGYGYGYGYSYSNNGGGYYEDEEIIQTSLFSKIIKYFKSNKTSKK